MLNEQRSRQNGARSGGGSVRRAREMAQVGFTAPSRPSEWEASPITVPQSMNTRPNERPRQTNPGKRQGPMPAALSNARSNPSTVGQAISKPAPMAQWPLQEDNTSRGTPNSPSGDRGRGPAPQRPPRPSNIPSLLDSSKIREYTPSMPYNQQQQQQQAARPLRGEISKYWEDSDRSTIPDFSVPAPPSQAIVAQRKGGPPPTTRRGPSSHYSALTHVSPIPEERDSRRGTGSFASSRVIPSSWGSHSPDEYDSEEGPYSKYLERDEGAGLVRQASLGQRHKPALRTIGSSDDTSEQLNRMQKINTKNIANGGIVAKAAVAAGASAGAVGAGFGASRYELPPVKTVLGAGRTVFLDTSSSSSSPLSAESLSAEIEYEKHPEKYRSKSPANPPINPRIAQLVGGLEGGKETLGGNPPAMSDRISGTRRPPRLDLDATREAEARGSLTSLPDLIKRATRLASNLDRGKTASRMGMLDMFKAGGFGGSQEKLESLSEKRPHSGSISDILASFPPPGLATPTGERPTSRWPSPFPVSPSRLVYHLTPPDTPNTSNLSQAHKKSKRKCCGMPLWAFILVFLVLIILVAAAVVVPVFLIVLPRQNKTNHDDTSLSSSICSNGGLSIVSGNAQRCVCVNGFTGDKCTIPSGGGCTTTDISNGTPSTFKNVTIGSSIPRLLSGSSANYSIPLNSSALLALFSSNNLSCSSENALVTFNGNAQKRSLPLLEANEAEANRLFSNPKPTPIGAVVHDLLFPRQNNPAATSNGIVFAATTAPGGSVTVTPTSSSTIATNSDTPTPTPQAVFIDAQTTDFARIVILFILQQTGNLTSAVSSQERIQGFFQNNTPNGTMGNSGNDPSLDFTIDFQNFSIALSNGTTVGGRGPSPSATPTASAGARI